MRVVVGFLATSVAFMPPTTVSRGGMSKRMRPVMLDAPSTRWLPSSTWFKETYPEPVYDDEDYLPTSSPTETPDGTIEMPLVVVDAPLLPSGTHSITVTDRSLQRLYDDILFSGTRRFVVALGRQEKCEDEFLSFPNTLTTTKSNYDVVVFSEDDTDKVVREPTAVAEMGCVLYLTDIKDTPQGRVCDHAIQPVRVRIQQVLRKRDGRLYCRVNVANDQENELLHKKPQQRKKFRQLEPSIVTSSSSSEHPRPEKRVLRTPEESSPDVVGSVVGAAMSLLHKLDHLQEAFVTAVKKQHRSHRWIGNIWGDATEKQVTTTTSKRRRRRPLDDQSIKEERIQVQYDVNGRNQIRAIPEPPDYEQEVVDELVEIAALQKMLDEDVCFREEALAALGAGPGVGVGSLWHLANSCWLSYLRTRATVLAHRVYSDLHERLVAFLEATGRLPPDFHDKQDDMNTVLSGDLALPIDDLPYDLQRDLLELKARVADEIEPIVQQHQAAQVLLDANSHPDRCKAFTALLRDEHARLKAKKSLKDLLDPPGYVKQRGFFPTYHVLSYKNNDTLA